MGTRHLICVYYKGRFQVAQYGQWDGYPSGQGIKILRFLLKSGNIERLKAGLEYIKVYKTDTQEDFAALSEEDRELLNSSASCSRDTGAGILEMVAQAGDSNSSWKPGSKILPIVLEVEFAQDGLFCEWAYVVDLDKEVLEVHGGQFALERRNLTPGTERFGEESGVGLIRSFRLDTLPESLECLEVNEDDEE